MTNSKALTGGDILAANDAKTERVEVPEWGGHIFVRVLTGAERDDFERRLRAAKHGVPPNLRALWASLVISDEHGRRLFSEKDVDKLADKSSRALDRVMEVGQQINGINDYSIAALEKNSEAGPSAGSGSS